MAEALELRRRLGALAARWKLDDTAVERLAALLEALERDPEAPTTVSEPGAAIDAHVADSLTGLQVDALRLADRVVDIGSGAGFPGLVLAIALPDSRFDLVESSSRKCRAIERLAGKAAIENARVVRARAEEWAAGEGATAYAASTARALGPLATILEYAAPLLRLGGVLVAWKGQRDHEEERLAAGACRELGMSASRVLQVAPFPSARSRHLHVYEKADATPPRFPRRPGMARKRPLGRRSGPTRSG